MSSFTHAAISPSGQGRNAIAFGNHLIRITADETAGMLGMMEVALAPGEGPPMHIHEREEEFIRVLDGRFAFWCADEYVELDEGGCITLPRGVPHRFQNVGDCQGRIMVVVTPGGLEKFFPIVEMRRPRNSSEIAEIATEFGLTFLAATEQRHLFGNKPLTGADGG